jgi:hypothetical protein
MKRDFTQETQDKLKTLVQEADEKWFEWTDSLGDFFLGVGMSEVIGFFGGIEAHQRALFDQNNTSLEDLQRIFNAVYEVDATYGTLFANHTEQLRLLHERLNAAGAAMINLSMYTSATEGFTDQGIKKICDESLGRYAEYLAEHPDALDLVKEIARYESMHPDYIDQTNTFLSALPRGDELAIKRLIYQADEPQRTLCLRYLDKFSITDTGAGVRGKFNPNNDTLVFDLENDRTGPRGSYYTFFHEVGHAIDWYYGKEQGSSHYSGTFTINGKTLMDTNYDDVRANLTVTAQSLLANNAFASLTPDQRSAIAINVVNNLMAQNRNFGNLTADEQALQDSLVRKYETPFMKADNESASDIYGGVTNRTVPGSRNTWGHNDPITDQYYWFDQQGQPNQGTNVECFAEYFGRIMVDDPQSTDGLNSISTYLPNSRTFLDQMLGGMK